MTMTLFLRRSKIFLVLIGIVLTFDVLATPKPRIVGGEESSINQWPFMAALMLKNVGITVADNNFAAFFMTGSPQNLFSGNLVNCEKGFDVCQNATDKICLIERGETFFSEKVQNCHAGGGIGAIIYNNEEDHFFGNLGDEGSRIPAVSTSRESGLALLNYLDQSVSFGYRSDSPENSFCGGSYIGQRWVVTAAHCVEDALVESLAINIGGHDLAENQTNVIDVEKIIIHPDYNSAIVGNDLALLLLKTEPQGVETISLADETLLTTAIDEGASVTALGRGQQEALNFGEIGSPFFGIAELYQTDITLVSRDACNDGFNTYLSDHASLTDLVTPDMVCAGHSTGEVGTCFGDSGGPLILNRDGENYLVGLTSWGFGCAQPELFDVFTRVPFFKSFIEEQILINQDDTTKRTGSQKINDDVFIIEDEGSGLFWILFVAPILIYFRIK